ncbi:MAG: RNA polymerase sigma factor SigW [Bacteroidales bacterium]|jgi:RNA polymerase sigma-70 factor (ECF subfamily)|nr:sigma-70 family RNA polymerase sigma factor [Bacteroidales bacterium]HOU97288.1 sigma-70 family RNA polymerase sigma factor [Bacteroidales bacterium]
MEISPNLSNKALQDYVLVQQAIKGDEKSFAELMGRYRDSIYFMLLKMVANKVDAEDLTIEAFTKAFRNLSQYSPSFAFSTWLFKIATNNCIDFLRKKKTDIISIDGPPAEGSDMDTSIALPSDTLDPEEELIREQKFILMRDVVEKLKPRYRMLIELRYFKEYSYEEISAELEIPIGTVKAQLFRARELLYLIIKKSKDKI